MIELIKDFPEFKGFSEYYHANILPELERGEVQRIEAVKKTKKAWVILGLIGVVAVISILLLGLKFPFAIFAIGLSIAAGVGLSAYFFAGIKNQTKEVLMGGICKFLGWDFTEIVETVSNIDSFINLGLLPIFCDRHEFEDRVSGSAYGADFELHEAHFLKRKKTKNGHRWVTVFRGQIMALTFDKKFLGETIVLRDQGWFNSKKRGELKRVGLVDPVFEKIFEAYGTDQVEARYMLTPTFMQRLVDLEETVDGKNIQFAFTGGQLLISVETQNRYEAGSMFTPLTDTEPMQKILDEIGAIFDVIDGVMKPS